MAAPTASEPRHMQDYGNQDYMKLIPVTVPGKTFIPKGCAIKFTDMSGGIPTDLFWRFEGGMPVTSTLQYPQHIIYDTAGIFSVFALCRNSIGEDSLLKTAYITVRIPCCPMLGLPTTSDTCYQP